MAELGTVCVANPPAQAEIIVHDHHGHASKLAGPIDPASTRHLNRHLRACRKDENPLFRGFSQ